MNLIRYPNPILNQKSEECTEADLPLIKESLPRMTQIVDGLKAAGLAAVQVGISKRFCIVKDHAGKNNLLINPELVEGLDLTSMREGCLSLPFFFESIDRFEEVTVKFKDENWAEKTAVFTGIESQCLQHELNHMNGTLIFDTVSKVKQDMWIKKAKKKGVL